MLFERTFNEVDRYIPNNEIYSIEKAAIENWEEFSQQITDYFWDDCEELIDLVSKDLKAKPFKNIKFEPFYFKKRNEDNDITLMSFKVDGKDNFNMGFKMSPHVFKGGYSLPYKHSLKFHLFFVGENEVSAFKEMYLNYKRIIEILLRKIDRFLGFYYTIDEPSSRHLEGKSLYYNLDKCFLEKYAHTPTHVDFATISIYCNEEDIMTIFKVFIALLDSCYNYAIARKSKDKILKYYTEIIK